MKELNLNKVTPSVLGTSQKGQDSLIQHTFDVLGTTNKYFVEFGARDGVVESNTFYLRTNKGWNGLLLDCVTENQSINLHNRRLLESNIVEVFDEFNVPIEFDFLSVDIDGNDFWLLKRLLGKYRPRVIMVETNVRFSPETDLVQKYDDNWFWQGSGWYGCSPRAMAKMADKHGYAPVHIHLDDMILVSRGELISNHIRIPEWKEIYPKSNIPLYDSHRDNVFNPDMWVTPEF